MIKYLSLNKLPFFLSKLSSIFSPINHSHSKTDIINALGYIPLEYGYVFEINDEGYLYLIYDDDSMPPNFSINDSGELILTLLK